MHVLAFIFHFHFFFFFPIPYLPFSLLLTRVSFFLLKPFRPHLAAINFAHSRMIVLGSSLQYYVLYFRSDLPCFYNILLLTPASFDFLHSLPLSYPSFFFYLDTQLVPSICFNLLYAKLKDELRYPSSIRSSNWQVATRKFFPSAEHSSGLSLAVWSSYCYT